MVNTVENENIIHGVIVDHLRQRLAREYREIKVNPPGDPDLILGNHGLVLAAVEVETEKSMTPEKAEKWRIMAQSGTKLILMVPRHSKAKVTEILWQKGIADKVSVGSYEIVISMP